MWPSLAWAIRCPPKKNPWTGRWVQRFPLFAFVWFAFRLVFFFFWKGGLAGWGFCYFCFFLFRGIFGICLISPHVWCRFGFILLALFAHKTGKAELKQQFVYSTAVCNEETNSRSRSQNAWCGVCCLWICSTEGRSKGQMTQRGMQRGQDHFVVYLWIFYPWQYSSCWTMGREWKLQVVGKTDHHNTAKHHLKLESFRAGHTGCTVGLFAELQVQCILALIPLTPKFLNVSVLACAS